jgi:hypothetical protein
MANSLTTNPIYIDVFSAAIDLADYLPDEIHLDSIEWARPTGTTNTCTLFSGGASGVTIFDEQCTTANQSIIKYFHGLPIKPPYVPVATSTLLASGKLIIIMSK